MKCKHMVKAVFHASSGSAQAVTNCKVKLKGNLREKKCSYPYCKKYKKGD